LKKITKMNYKNNYQTEPSSRILKTAIKVGFISFLIGFIGPILLTDNNLGPLLGIFLTGPVGTLVGALMGIVWSALHAGTRSIRTELRWLGSIWGLSLFFLIFVINGFGDVIVIAALSVQVLVITIGIFMIGNSKVRRNLPQQARRYGTVFLCAAVLIVLTSIFPPVSQNRWMSQQRKNRISTLEPLPKFVFIQDIRLDASKQVPELTIAKGKLVCEWVVIATAAGFVSLIIAGRIKRSNLRPKV
jgi:hypothetical protein